MRKVLVFFLLVINIILLYGAYQLLTPLFTSGTADLMIETEDVNASVFLNGKAVGKTPFLQKGLRAGNYTVKLTADLEATNSANATASASASNSARPKAYKSSWESTVKLTPKTQTVIKRTLGPADIFSGGEILTLEKGSGLAIISNPEGADVSIDGKKVGSSPISVEEKGRHEIKIEKEGYFGRELTIKVDESYRLTISVNLALNPLTPLTEKDKKDNFRLVDFSTTNSTLLGNSQQWADGVFYYSQKLASASAKVDLLLDYKGATFSATPRGWDTKIRENKSAIFGYLGKKDEAVTPEAKKVFENLVATLSGSTVTTSDNSTPSAGSKGQIQISDTPTGFLRVRSTPSTASSEVGRVSPGEKYQYTEERNGWYKIKITDGKEGWVSGQYAQKQ